MKKIGIITLNGYFNYGNRLQNYALQEILEKIGCVADTILVPPDTMDLPENGRRRLPKGKKIHWFFRKIFSSLWSRLHRKEIIRGMEYRKKRFIKFSIQYLHETNIIEDKQCTMEELEQWYDFFITGSDQVWNPYYIHLSSYYFLTFAPRRKRIAYSPSFGITVLPEQVKMNYREWIQGMEHLSVREEAGAAIIYELTGRKAKVLLDPTMLLTRKDWDELRLESKWKPKRNYIAIYFLDQPSHNIRKSIVKIAKQYGLELVFLGDIKDRKGYCAGPREFIDYIADAHMLITDSFHGSVFSILYETPFLVCDRGGDHPSMTSRIDTLLQTFQLTNCRWDGNSRKELFVDFSTVAEVLQKEREKAITYLKEALELEEELYE